MEKDLCSGRTVETKNDDIAFRSVPLIVIRESREWMNHALLLILPQTRPDTIPTLPIFCTLDNLFHLHRENAFYL